MDFVLSFNICIICKCFYNLCPQLEKLKCDNMKPVLGKREKETERISPQKRIKTAIYCDERK